MAIKETMSLVVEDSETGELKDLKPELVVLAVGISPSSNADKIAEKLGISRDASGFFTSLNEKTAIVETNRPGIYIAGTAVAPKDIPGLCSGCRRGRNAFIYRVNAGLKWQWNN